MLKDHSCLSQSIVVTDRYTVGLLR